MTNILFIGGGGFIGSNLIEKITEKPDFNTLVFEPSLANLSRLNHLEDKIKIVRGYLADYDLMKSVILTNSIHLVVHLVSTLIPGSDYEDYKKEFEQVIFPSVQLMGLCAERNIKFVFFSSGGTIYGDNCEGKFKESDKLAPISYYGLSKQIIEDSILFENRTKNLNYLIIRPSNPFGPGQAINAHQGLIAVAIGKILAGEPIVIWGDGTNVRDYIYIEDLANSFVQLIDNEIGNEIINIGSGNGCSINDLLSILKNITQTKVNIVYETNRSVDVGRMVLDVSKLHSLVGIRHTSLQDGIGLFFETIKTMLKSNGK